MNRELVNIIKLHESFIRIKHKFGLTIFLKPIKRFSSCMAIFATKYGSVNRQFKTSKDNNFLKVPDGIAHYLEHKLFENENERDAIELFANKKAIANAQTSFDSTAYYFSSPAETFLDALKILINFVQSPFFTDENVDRERGIINQEIKMNEDNPEWMTFFKCLEAMYKESSLKIKISGSVSSIANIDKGLLYKCYDAFYSLNNMALILVGDFDELEVLSLIDSNLKFKESVLVEQKLEFEPYEVNKNYCELYMPVKNPIFYIGYKLSPKRGKDLLKAKVGLEILCEILIGEGSELYNEFYENFLVPGGELNYEILAGVDYFALLFSGESSNPKKVLERISQEINNKKENGVNEKDLELVKRVIFAKSVREFSVPESMAFALFNSFIEDFEISDRLDLIANFNVADIMECLNVIDVSNCSLAISFPTDNS